MIIITINVLLVALETVITGALGVMLGVYFVFLCIWSALLHPHLWTCRALFTPPSTVGLQALISCQIRLSKKSLTL